MKRRRNHDNQKLTHRPLRAPLLALAKAMLSGYEGYAKDPESRRVLSRAVRREAWAR